MINTKQYNKLLDLNKTLQDKNLKLIYKKNYFKIGLGFVCLTIAVFPNGLGVLFYPLSFMLLGISIRDLEDYKRRILNKIRGAFK
jgi:hypothetical protein